MNVLLSQIKAMMLKLYTISSRTFIMVTVLFRLTNAILKIRKSFLPVTLSVKPVLLCTRTAYSLIETEPVRSTAALSRGLKSAVVPATINAGNGRKNRGCTKYVTLPNDYRLSIDRDCVSFKKIYALRTEAERYNSRFKSTGLERL